MGGRSTQTFLQRRYTDGQKACENMLSITNYQRNANQNYNSDISQNGHHQYLQTINAGEDVEKREPSDIVGGNINWYSHCREQYRAF